MGYHLTEPTRGEYGDLSKIYEEIDELKDAQAQDASLMVLQELSDIIGAIEGYLNKHHPSVTLKDLIVMKDITARAFKDGTRTARSAGDEAIFVQQFILDNYKDKPADYMDAMARLREAKDAYRQSKTHA